MQPFEQPSKKLTPLGTIKLHSKFVDSTRDCHFMLAFNPGIYNAMSVILTFYELSSCDITMNVAMNFFLYIMDHILHYCENRKRERKNGNVTVKEMIAVLVSQLKGIHALNHDPLS